MAVQPSRVFSQNLERLAGTSAAIAEAHRGRGARPWQTPPEDSWGGDHDDPADLTPAFDRDPLNDAYARAVSTPGSPGSVGDSVAISAQVGVVGSMERAYRARWASPLRCLLVASSRRAGHGDERGVLLGAVAGRVQGALAAAGVSAE